MCNEYQLILPFDDVIAAFNLTGNRLVFPGGMPNFGPMASIRIGDRAPIIQMGAEGPEAVLTPWAWKGPGGRPVFNFRSDGRAFGCYIHGLFTSDEYRSAFLARYRGKTLCGQSALHYETQLDGVLDRLAAQVERDLDVDEIARVAGLG